MCFNPLNQVYVFNEAEAWTKSTEAKEWVLIP